MDINKTIDFIIRDLQETRDIIDDLKNYPDVPLIQIELAKSKCKSAEELIELLKVTGKKNEAEPITVTLAVEENSIEQIAETHTENIVVETAGILVTETPKSINPLQNGKTILSDKFSTNTSSINEQIGNRKGDGDINSIFRSKPINNLEDVIGINDKFYYIREIFTGNHTSYEEALKKLNMVNNVDDARSVITSFTGERKPNDAIGQLIELVKRKISSHE